MSVANPAVVGCAANFKQVEVRELSFRDTTGEVHDTSNALNLSSLRLHLDAGLCRPCLDLYTSYRRVHERAEDVEAMVVERFAAMAVSLPAANVTRIIQAILTRAEHREDFAEVLERLPFTISRRVAPASTEVTPVATQPTKEP